MGNIVCKICGKSFYCKPCRINPNGNYCSRACDNQRQRPVVLPPAECKICGKMFQRNPSKRKGGDNLFCSRKCSGIAQREVPRELKCETCGKPFTRIACFLVQPGQGRFCSRKCMYASKGSSTEIQCQVCDKVFCRKTSQVQRYGIQICSRACMGVWRSRQYIGENNANWRGGYQEYYGPDWTTQRKAARQRDKYRCQVCKITEKKLGRELDVHHIQPFRTFGYTAGENERYKEANRLANLISLCPSCHKLAEHNKVSVQLRLI